MEIQVVDKLPDGGEYEGHIEGTVWCWRDKKTGNIYKVRPPMMAGCSEATKFKPYLSPINDKPIMNEHERREDLKRNNCVDAREFGDKKFGGKDK